MGRHIRHAAAVERGFTLIELLVVILIIGVLAAIAIPTFLTQAEKSHDADAKAAARTAQTAMEACRTDHDDYTGCALADLETIEPTLHDATIALSGIAAATYTITSTASTGHTFTVIHHADGSVTRSATGASW